MNLSKSEREALKAMYGNRCAYCGTPLLAKWHADHVKPVQRIGRWVRQGNRYVHVDTGIMHHPERDTLSNFKPACVPCNIHKGDLSLESWRKILADAAASLHRNYATYRHAHRFGLIAVRAKPIRFFFESGRRMLP